jgi:tetratricopeptide (TPR) repeat protein
VTLAILPASAQSVVSADQDLDALYRDRERSASALAAERGWTARVSANAGDFESAWKLARIRYWLGTNGPGKDDEKKRRLEGGIAAGRLAMAARPDAPDGHFWMAANMGALADAHGLRQGIRYRGPIKAALEKALSLSPGYLDGSPDRALGRWYFKVPRLFGGDLAKSEEHLRKALTYKVDSIISLLFLGETLIERGKSADARVALQKAIDTAPDPDWVPEDTVFQAQARALLKKLAP